MKRKKGKVLNKRHGHDCPQNQRGGGETGSTVVGPLTRGEVVGGKGRQSWRKTDGRAPQLITFQEIEKKRKVSYSRGQKETEKKKKKEEEGRRTGPLLSKLPF